MIEIELSNVKYIRVSAFDTAETKVMCSTTVKNIPGIGGSLKTVGLEANSHVWTQFRIFEVRSNGIYFKEGHQYSLSVVNNSTQFNLYTNWNFREVPYEIIGIY